MSNNGTWGDAILIQIGVIILWIVLLLTPLGSWFIDILVGVNTIGT